MQTISEEYRELNRQLHADRPDYGSNGHRFAPQLLQLARSSGATTMLDYGCGKGTLAPVLRANGLECAEYDPAIEGKDTPPEPAQIVYCGDVAEHVEPEYIDAFLDDLLRVTAGALVLTVATRPAAKTLADGRNAHISNYPLEWWLPKLTSRFAMSQLIAASGEFTFVGEPK